MVRLTVKRKPNWRGIRKHRPYRVDEAARTLGVCKATVRRWIKQGLPTIDNQKPMMVLGRNLIEFHEKRKRAKAPCGLGEFFCFRCRQPKPAAFGEAEIVSATAKTVNLRALCATCSTIMHKRVSLRKLASLAAILTIQNSKQTNTLINMAHLSLIVHSQGR
ncbi:helix-turn-helix domain-containing protein [Marinicaulis aureus]|uniref:Helix-turn-helix domain-containing protein n=1 Tax=Hyphococcus aureus TaxID=2666033 RepID=A0ABW1L3V4_9PROT